MRTMKREAILLVNSWRLHDTGEHAGVIAAEDCIHSERHFRPLRRRQFLAGRSLLRHQLQQTTGIPGEAWRIVTDEGGRPRAVGPDGQPGPDLSVSHSGEWVVSALVTQGRIGIDIELTRRDRPATAMAEVALSADEQVAVSIGGEPAFLRFWTLREAIGKAEGGGLDAALEIEGAILLGVAGAPAAVTLGGAPWILAQRMFEGGALAVAWRIGDAAVAEAPSRLADALDAGLGPP